MTPAALGQLGGWSALVAAVATIVGMVTLLQFFRVGGVWGRLNDASSVVLMLALIPVAVVVAVFELETVATLAMFVAAIGIVGMVLAALFPAALLAGAGTFEQLRNRTLGASALVGLWYILAGYIALTTEIPVELSWAAVAAGIGLVAVAWGFVIGGHRHPAAIVGGLLAFLGSVVFLVGFGYGLVTRSLAIPEWNL